MTYTIKQVSEKFGLSIFTIRFYDKEGLLPFVARNKAGNREFTESDLKMIQTICCLKNTGMQIKDIKEYVNYCMAGAGTIESRKQLLQNHRKEILAQIEALNKNLDLIDEKIGIYESPNAVEIINSQIKMVIDEKRENSLISYYAQMNNR